MTHFSPGAVRSAVAALLLLPSLGALALASPGAGATDSVASDRNDGDERHELAPRVEETRYYRVVQTVALHDVPETAELVRLWTAVPVDGPWQRVLDMRVIEAPEGWSLVRQPASGGAMIYSESPAAARSSDPVKVVVEYLVQREAPAVDMRMPTDLHVDQEPLQRALFGEFLRTDASLMEASEQVRSMAREACKGAKHPREKVLRLLDAVASSVDHYSKDASKPHCGRGAASDCLEHGGGCCTDIHSLFIAMARAEGIPARLQMGHRLRGDREGQTFDPSYRCWVEFWLDGSGWVPTDIVVADSGSPEWRAEQWGRVDARRVWLWEGRGYDLVPKQAGPPIQTMHSGWAEIDGVAVDPLPKEDGTPSRLRRTVRFADVTDAFTEGR
ncbi:MAG TPA: transglutaminase-like domain-containing protein [Phycisphaerales bacterium]|nr:transglutaminase-like domain-containing protein [Phycisphaerales bacterium]HMP37000.1 transglutaminase-like domain-containing protein [Phycisphaerales bacterium]